MIFKGERVVVSQGMWKEIKQRLHQTNLGADERRPSYRLLRLSWNQDENFNTNTTARLKLIKARSGNAQAYCKHYNKQHAMGSVRSPSEANIYFKLSWHSRSHKTLFVSSIILSVAISLRLSNSRSSDISLLCE